MELSAEIKLEGDGYAGGFSCGLSMCRSKTIENFKKVNETALIWELHLMSIVRLGEILLLKM